MMLRADADTKLFFLAGDPMDFSCGAAVSNAVFDFANVNAVNLSLTVKKGELGPFVKAVRTLGLAGFFVTMPHKSDIIPYLDEVDPLSRAFHCVNHIKNDHGKLIGTALDGVGMRMAIEGAGVSLPGKSVLILGAGGVAGPIAAELAKQGARRFAILNRTVEKAKFIEKVLHEHFDVETAVAEMIPENLHTYAKDMDLAVQCTSLGMNGGPADYADVTFVDEMKDGALVADVLYIPDRTKLLSYAERQGHPVVNGMVPSLNTYRSQEYLQSCHEIPGISQHPFRSGQI
ncbi:MAG: saccharopine dehydrogenase NADP-binding domain-containing protein, partial [Clostridiales bacterium]|nr:saccharopine dehydrogenase NADP-binding domain-containing protein [Clostridiales bacterium]